MMMMGGKKVEVYPIFHNSTLPAHTCPRIPIGPNLSRSASDRIESLFLNLVCIFINNPPCLDSSLIQHQRQTEIKMIIANLKCWWFKIKLWEKRFWSWSLTQSVLELQLMAMSTVYFNVEDNAKCKMKTITIYFDRNENVTKNVINIQQFKEWK